MHLYLCLCICVFANNLKLLKLYPELLVAPRCAFVSVFVFVYLRICKSSKHYQNITAKHSPELLVAPRCAVKTKPPTDNSQFQYWDDGQMTLTPKMMSK